MVGDRAGMIVGGFEDLSGACHIPEVLLREVWPWGGR